MNGAVVYQSKYGSTRQYAEWLSEALQVKLINVKENKAPAINSYDFLVFCSPVYYGKLLISSFIKKNWRILKGRKVYLLVVAGMDEKAEDDINNMLDANFDQKFAEYKIKWYYSGGRMEVEKLGFFERFLINRLAKMVKEEKEKEKLQKGYDFIDRQKLNSLVAQIREEMGSESTHKK